jgi:hypothetical protein
MLVYTNEERNLKIYSLDSTRWKDFELLFGERGACGGCWCMAWRLKKSEFELGKGEPNKFSMKSIVYNHEPAGVLAYVDDKPIGWCAVAPREVYKRLESKNVEHEKKIVPLKNLVAAHQVFVIDFNWYIN